ncbi:uncharacterized protein LOC123523693 [Mercenaria mercenaria]|uniref:uncharacterized protein LOC123523693 n=1 Tax=Mercenaria mercenaria TaxID=6596 RepID=UPI001E1D8448|nr:uncharacterized protein LOC123523693 [Mercenaria mercenaria]
MLRAKDVAFEHIEDLYNSLNKQLCKRKVEDLNKVLPYKNKCQAITFDIKTLESFFKEKKKCDKYHLFLAMKTADIKIKSNLDDLNEMKSEKCLKVRRYSFKPDSGITNMSTQPVSFGLFDDIDNATKLANPVATLHAGDVDDENTCCVTGLTVLSNTRLVLVDNNNRSVKLLNTEEGTIMSKVKYESAPWDITLLKPGKQLVAITVPETENVHFLSVIENAILEKLQQKHIKVNGKCYGITNSNDKIFVTVMVGGGQSAKLEQYDLDGQLTTSVKLGAWKPLYVILNADETTLYISDNARERHITELSRQNMRQLNTLSLCRDEVIGMTVDKTGALYYCDSYYYAIDYVNIGNKKGERKRINLLPKATPHPKCLAYFNPTDTLFVGKDGNDIDVYTVL